MNNKPNKNGFIKHKRLHGKSEFAYEEKKCVSATNTRVYVKLAQHTNNGK